MRLPHHWGQATTGQGVLMAQDNGLEPRFCTACGKPLVPGARFCGICGVQVVRPQARAIIVPVEEKGEGEKGEG